MRRVGLSVAIAVVAVIVWLSGVQLVSPGSTDQTLGARLSSDNGAPRAWPAIRDSLGIQPSGVSARAASSTEPSPPVRAQAVSVIIPRLRVHAPVYEGGVSQSGVLTIVPGYALTHLKFSADLGKVGNYVLYGHDDIDGQILRDLPALRPDDLIDLYQGSYRFVYQVVARRIVLPTDTAVMDATDSPTLTLISCFPYMVDTQRIVVQAALIQIDEQVKTPA